MKLSDCIPSAKFFRVVAWLSFLVGLLAAAVDLWDVSASLYAYGAFLLLAARDRAEGVYDSD